MTLPALADLDMLAARLGGHVDDALQAEALLAYASALVRADCGQGWVDDDGALTDVPDAVRLVVVEIVARVTRNPDGITQEQAGPFQRSFGPQATERMFLTAADRRMLGPHKVTGGVWVGRVTRGPVETPAVIDPLRGAL